MKYIQSGIIFCLIAFVVTSCTNRNQDLILSIDEIAKTNEVDTIEAYPERGLYIVNIINNRAFGHFSMNYALIKVNKSNMIVYKMKEGRGEEGRVSKDFIAFVKSSNSLNWGWFSIQDGKIQTELPKIRQILDSLKLISPKNAFIKEANGYISFLVDGKLVKSLNYGECVTTHRNLNFDTLTYKLYKLDNDSLSPISDNGDDLFSQERGVFFIPSPGYGVIRRFHKLDVIAKFDSASKLQPPPSTIKVKAIE